MTPKNRERLVRLRRDVIYASWGKVPNVVVAECLGLSRQRITQIGQEMGLPRLKEAPKPVKDLKRVLVRAPTEDELKRAIVRRRS
jgi:hypothetical protein